MTDTPVAVHTTTGITSAADRRMTVIAAAHATSDDGESPTYCRFAVTEAFANRPRHLRLCKAVRFPAPVRIMESRGAKAAPGIPWIQSPA